MSKWGAKGSAQYRKTNREYQQAYRAKYPEQHKETVERYRRNNLSRIRELDLARRQAAKDRIRQAKCVPCADCAEIYPPYVMDFDHVRGKKIANIGSGRFHSSVVGLEKEIAKCDVVCANCHREREHQRRMNAG